MKDNPSFQEEIVLIVVNFGHCVPGLVVAEKIRKSKIISVDWI